MTPRWHHWAAALLLALALHGAALAWWLGADDTEGAHAAGHDGLQVGVGLAGSFAEPSQDSQTEQFLPTDKKVEAEPTQAQLPEPIYAPEQKPNDAATMQEAAPKIEEPAALPATRTAPKLRPEPASVPEKQAKPKAQAATRNLPDPTVEQQPRRTEAPIQPVADASRNQSKRSSLKATGTGQRVETGGNPAARQSYLAEVLARIARHKRYPREARHDGVIGVVTVTFTITANGTVLTQHVSGSSGDHRLDKAALEMLLRASPLPPIPRDMDMASLELTLPVEFSLNQKRKIF